MIHSPKSSRHPVPPPSECLHSPIARDTIATLRGAVPEVVSSVAWMRMMGRDSVEYHRETVMDRADDHRGLALAYYDERGESPMRWGGAGCADLGLSGEVTPKEYEAIFGVGGARHPLTGERLVKADRPGL